MNNLSVFGSALKDFDKFFVGFDEQFNRLTKLQASVVAAPASAAVVVGSAEVEVEVEEDDEAV